MIVSLSRLSGIVFSSLISDLCCAGGTAKRKQFFSDFQEIFQSQRSNCSLSFFCVCYCTDIRMGEIFYEQDLILWDFI